MIEEVKIINFRNLNNLNIEIGKKLTLISGGNGIGKSTILGIIASCSGSKDFKSLTGKSMYPDFTNYFILDKSEHREGEEKYKVVTKYSIDKKNSEESMNVYKFITTSHPNYKRLKIVPRTSDEMGTQKSSVQEETEQLTGISKDQVIPIATEYLSSSRILPFGETTIDQKVNTIIRVKKRKNIPDPDIIAAKYVEYYNNILPSSFPKPSVEYQYELFEVSKPELKGETYLIVKPKNFEIPAMSLGQDSVSKIVNSLLDFYSISKDDNYNGGILLIDELDLSLHPDAQVRLLKLLKKCADELKLQIIFTTHSLTLIKEMKKLEHGNSKTENSEMYKVAYLRGRKKTRVSYDDTYDLIKKDLFQAVRPDMLPKTKIYFEDSEARIIFDQLLSFALQESYITPDVFSTICGNTELIESMIGSDILTKLPFKDSYFQSVVIILDGDAQYTSKLKNQEFLTGTALSAVKQSSVVKHHTNTLFLPCFPSPEQFLFISLKNMCDDYENHESFWESSLHIPGVNFYYETANTIIEDMISKNQTNRENLKEWFNNYLSVFFDVGLFPYVFSNFINQDDLKFFISDIVGKINNQINIKIAKRF